MDDILSTINMIEKAILEGKRPMLGTGKIVDDAAILSMINYLRNILPEEIKISKMVTKNKDEILSIANSEAKKIKTTAHSQACKILDEHELRHQAEIEAKEILLKANKYLESVTHDVNVKVLDIITNVENNLKEMIIRVNDVKNDYMKDNKNPNEI